MRLQLAYKVFGALLLMSLTAALLTVGVLRYSIDKDFDHFFEPPGMDRTGDLLRSLAGEFKERRGWANLRTEPQQWSRLVADGLAVSAREPVKDGHRYGRRSDGHHDDERHDAHGQNRHEAVLAAASLFLLDEARRWVAGAPYVPGGEVLEAIRVDGRTVGWLGRSRWAALDAPRAVGFLTRQHERLYLVGAAILALNGLIADLFARHLLTPIRKLAAGTRELASRRFQARIDVSSKDELGQLATDFNAMAAAFEKAEVMRQQWMADIAHELRTPLAVLRGEIEAMQDRVRAVTAQRLASLHAEVSRLAKLVEDLRHLSLADAGAMSFRRDSVEVVGLLRRTLRRFETRLTERGIRVRDELGAGPGARLSGDADRLDQAFANLLENALRHVAVPGCLRLWRTATDACVTLGFEDSGPGVPAAAIDRLFDRLYRVDPSRSRDFGGSGLGLSICKSIVEAHGGSIHAENAPGAGLRIRIVLPLA